QGGGDSRLIGRRAVARCGDAAVPEQRGECMPAHSRATSAITALASRGPRRRAWSPRTSLSFTTRRTRLRSSCPSGSSPSSTVLRRVDLIDRQVPVICRELPAAQLFAFARGGVFEQLLRDLFFVRAGFLVAVRDLDAIVPARRLVGVELRMVDAVVDDVA